MYVNFKLWFKYKLCHTLNMKLFFLIRISRCLCVFLCIMFMPYQQDEKNHTKWKNIITISWITKGLLFYSNIVICEYNSFIIKLKMWHEKMTFVKFHICQLLGSMYLHIIVFCETLIEKTQDNYEWRKCYKHGSKCVNNYCCTYHNKCVSSNKKCIEHHKNNKPH